MPDNNIDHIVSQAVNIASCSETAEEIPAVEAVSSVTTEELVVQDLPPAAAIEPVLIHQENRGEHRIYVKWHVDALIEGQIWHGFVKEISIGGASIFLEHNCHKIKIVKLHIHVPPSNKSSPNHVLDVSAKIIFTAYDSGESLFRSGVKFLKFNLESDSAYLLYCIENH